MGDRLMASPARRGAVNSSASHVFRVLRFVAEGDEPLGVTEIARRLNLPVSTVFRALATLEESSYIQRHNNAPRFEIGTMPHLLKRALYNSFPLHSVSRPHLRALAEQTGETVSLSVRLGWYMVRIAGAFGSHDVYHTSRLGEMALLHEAAEGRSVLAVLPQSERTAYYRFVEAHHAARVPPDGWAGMDARLTENAVRNYDVQDVPAAPRLRAVALPINDAHGDAVAALLVDGPILSKEDTQLNPSILAAKRKLEALLAEDYQRLRSPFDHLPHNSIRLHLI
jgi:DNA-binding IclR family transcriptional regulator